MRRFIALDLSLDLISAVREPLDRIRRKDRDLADQLLRAATSTSLNLGEGSGRRGADRVRCHRIAAGSAHEARTALRVAVALGYVTAAEVARAADLSEQVVRITAALTR